MSHKVFTGRLETLSQEKPISKSEKSQARPAKKPDQKIYKPKRYEHKVEVEVLEPINLEEGKDGIVLYNMVVAEADVMVYFLIH
jgi:hypothetical protein